MRRTLQSISRMMQQHRSFSCVVQCSHSLHLVTWCALQVEQLYKQASQALALPEDRFKLVLKGSTITNSSAAAAARETGDAGAVTSSSTPSTGFLTSRRQSAVIPLSAGGAC